MNAWHFISSGWVVNNPYIWKMRDEETPLANDKHKVIF